MLFKSLVFRHRNKENIVIRNIPVIKSNHVKAFLLSAKLQLFVTKINRTTAPKKEYCFQSFMRCSVSYEDYVVIFYEAVS
ncbi:MAG: DUF2535 family protein [Bacilli bacterium]